MRYFKFNRVWPIAILISSAILFSSSCVTQKKYLALEQSKKNADSKVTELNNEVDILKKDFEEYRISSSNNLTSKQYYVDSLSRIVFLLNTDITSKDDNIEDQVFSFQLEKGRLNQELNEKDKEIRNLTREINTLKVQKDDLTKKLDDATSNKRFPFGQVKQLERKLQSRDTEILELNLKLGNAQIENDSLQSKIVELTTEIGSLTGNETQQKLDSIGEE